MGYVLPWEEPNTRGLARRLAGDTSRLIVEGVLEPGAWITEAELAHRAGVSRTPAREAMLKLQDWGLVRLNPKKGATVSLETPRTRRDLLAVRVMLERSAVEQLMVNPERSDALAESLTEIVERQRHAADAKDPLAFAGADYSFHVQVIESMGNEVVAEILERIGPRLARMTHLVVSEHPEMMPQLLREHQELADLIVAGDTERFASKVRAHVATGHELEWVGRYSG